MKKTLAVLQNISIIVPSYGQEKTIKKNLESIVEVLDGTKLNYEIILVIDGKLDKTAHKAKNLNLKNLKVVELDKRYGKGYAVRKGVEKAKGEVVGFIDAGMDIDPNGIQMLLNHMIWYDADIIVGSKLHPVSRVEYPFLRKVLSWGYRTFTHILFGFKIRDTQVGIKFFKSNVAKDVFSRSLVKDFAFDVEVLALAYSLGYKKIFEAPIKLVLNKKSSITNANFWKVVLRMFIDTLGIYYRLKITQYYKKSNKKNWITE